VEIQSITHKALRRFIETGKIRGVMEAGRIQKMITYMLAISDVEELRIPPNYGAHELGADRAGTWALTVTKNWRMTFRVDDEGRIIELDLEDYH
jgi:proteic killer suppression protein